MRITFVLPYADMSGGVRVVGIHARNLQERGHTVLVVSRPRPRLSWKRKVKFFLRNLRLPREIPQGPTHLEKAGVPWKILDTPRPVEDRDLPDADILVATWWDTAPSVARLSPSKGLPVHLVQHYETFGGPKDEVDAALRLIPHKVVVSPWLGELMEKEFSPRMVRVVPNAVDLDQFHAPPRGKQLEPTVGLIYTPVAFKGCDISLEAFRRARRKIPGLRLVAFGERKDLPGLPLPEDTEFHLDPPQDKLREIYAACDAWLFGSRSEGFGLPILEAMACRTPLVATPAGIAPSALAEERGILVPHEDPATMAGGIERIAAMKENEWKDLSRRAWEYARRFNWTEATALLEEAFREALSTRGKGR